MEKGTAGFIDWAAIPERIRLIASAEPILVMAAIAVTTVILLSSAGDRRKAAIIAAALGTLMVLVLKHFSIRYLMPVVAIAPAVIIWAISRFTRRQSSYAVVAG